MIAEVYGWPEAEAFGVELPIELVDHALDPGTGDRKAKLGNSMCKESLSFGLPVSEAFDHLEFQPRAKGVPP